MQTANILLSLGGDKNNSVPKYVTAAEIPVLMAIHGEDAVAQIEPVGEVERSAGEELNRLAALYRAKDDDGNVVLTQVYPGRGAPLPQTLDSLNLPDGFYAATARAKPAAPKKRAGTKAKTTAPAEPAEPDFGSDDEPAGVMG